ncbi:MAG: NAD(P)-dependent oxidoreductase [Armatimonadetes bacterium]|nr:NAD(P)-dependent oxidoreductase [Armatimonadota bacterium]
MRVLVTGHSGYIGTVLVPVLRAAGHDVVGLDTGFYAGCGLPRQLEPIPELQKDIRDVEPADLAGVDAVAHLAALCNDPLGNLDADLTLEINYRATVRLAHLARAAGVRRFLFASSCSMYGTGSEDGFLTEDASLRPLTPYAESKVRAEEDLSRLADHDFSPVFLRNATAYGVSPRLRADVVLNNLVGWAHTTGKVRILSDGMSWRPIVHVEDIAHAFLACLESPREAIHNRAFNVGVNAENYRVRELAQIVQKVVPGATVEYAGQNNPDPRSYRVDFTRIQQELPAFKPTWTARAGAEQLYRAMQVHALNSETFHGPRFVRLAQIRQLMADGAVDGRLRWTKASVAA